MFRSLKWRLPFSISDCIWHTVLISLMHYVTIQSHVAVEGLTLLLRIPMVTG
jgi:hypothetical protein